jgi:beta-N-acetylhexosaminidase
MKSDFGDHLILGIAGVQLSDEEKRLLSDLSPRGVLLLGRNFDHGTLYEEWLESLKTLLDEISQYSEQPNPIISIDHEGGRVTRTPLPITPFPPAKHYRELSESVGNIHGRELASLGVNVTYAPICDVHSNPNNPIIGPRAFSTLAKEAGTFALQYHQGLRVNNVLGCAKHFPGHGDTDLDSHLTLPVVGTSLEEAKKREFLPFIELIKDDVPLIMTAHVLFPAIDSLVATLSSKLLTEILRQELGYKGVIISDDLEMNAVADTFRDPTTLGKAFNAGCDLFIISRYPNTNLEFTEMIAKNFSTLKDSGALSRFDESKNLLAKLDETLPKNEVTPLSDDIFKEHYSLSLKISGLTL